MLEKFRENNSSEFGEYEAPTLNESINENDQHSFTDRLRAFSLKSLVAIELLPITNEGIRYGSLALALTKTHSPFIGALMLGGSTLLVEGAGSLAAAELIKTKTDEQPNSTNESGWLKKNTIDRVDKMIPKRTKIPLLTEAGIALTAGSVISMYAKQLENQSRSKFDRKKRGLQTVGLMSGFFAAQGGLIAEGLNNVGNPTILGASLAGIGILYAGAKKAYNNTSKLFNKDDTK